MSDGVRCRRQQVLLIDRGVTTSVNTLLIAVGTRDGASTKRRFNKSSVINTMPCYLQESVKVHKFTIP